MQQLTGDLIIQIFKMGNDKEIFRVYDFFRSDFLSWAQRQFSIAECDAKDIYQDSFAAFFQNITEENFISFQAEPKTYLYSIAKYKILNLKKKTANTINLYTPDDTNILEVLQNVDNEDDCNEETFARLHQALNIMSKECREILELFYFRGLKINQIASEMEYKNENVTKAKKSQCLKKLAGLLKF